MADLTDLEITKLCAEASQVWKIAHKWFPTGTLDSTFSGVEIRWDKCFLVPNNPMRQVPQVYDPIHDDAQAMALVKKLQLSCDWRPSLGDWFVHSKANTLMNVSAADLNRAICKCVAMIQLERNRG